MKIRNFLMVALMVSIACLFSACENTVKGMDQDIAHGTKAVKKSMDDTHN